MTAPRSCDELGLCQARTPRCTGCAPAGLTADIDCPKDRQISRLMKWALIWALATGAVAAVMFTLEALS